MRSFKSEDSFNSDTDLDDSLSEAENRSDDGNEALFKARIDEHREQSLNLPDTLLGLLGNQNAGLFEMMHFFENRLKEKVATHDRDLLEIPEVGWMVAICSTLAKQNNGYTNSYLKREAQLRQAELDPLKRRTSNDRNKFRP